MVSVTFIMNIFLNLDGDLNHCHYTIVLDLILSHLAVTCVPYNEQYLVMSTMVKSLYKFGDNLMTNSTKTIQRKIQFYVEWC